MLAQSQGRMLPSLTLWLVVSMKSLRLVVYMKWLLPIVFYCERMKYLRNIFYIFCSRFNYTDNAIIASILAVTETAASQGRVHPLIMS